MSVGKPPYRLLEVDEAHGRSHVARASARFVTFSEDLLTVCGFDGLVKWVNPAHEAVLGYSKEELIGKPCREFLHPDDLERAVAEAEKLSTPGRSTDSFEARVRSRDGSYRWFRFTATVSLEEELIYGVGKDITEPKETEEALRQAESLFLRAFDHAPIGMVFAALDGRFLRVNRSFAKMLGRPSEEILGIPFWDITYPTDRDAAATAMSRLISGEISVYKREQRYVHAEGHVVWVLLNMIVVPDAEGAPAHFFAQVQDITERKRLQEQSERFLDVSLDLLGIAGFDGYMKQINPTWEEVFGYTQEEILSKPYIEFIHPNDHEKVAEAARQLLVGLEVTNLELRTRRKDGSYRWFIWSARPSTEAEVFYAVGKDITDRRNTEEELREAEERFRAAFEQAPIGMALVSIERERPGCFLRVNRLMCEITGLSEHELLGTDFRAIAHPDEVESDLHYVRWMLTGDTSQYEIEKRLRHADGHTLWALVTVSLVRDAHDRPLYLIAQIQDITARKEAERALWESRERLQDIIDNTTAVIYLKDREGRFLLVNDRFETLYDLRRDEVVGKRDHDLFPPDVAEAFRANDLKVLATGMSSEVEEIAFHEDGSHTYLSTRFPLFHATDPKGPPYAVCTISTDITERKRAEEALRASEEHFKRIVNTAHVAFVSMDAAGTITAWNPQAEQTFGWSESEAVGRSLVRTIVPERYRERHLEGMEQFRATGKGPILDRRIEIEALHRAGHEFPVELSVTPVRVNGEYFFNAFLHDITERKRAEENLRQLANVVESSGDAIIAATPERVIASWNPGAERLYGYTPAEAIGQSIDMLVPSHRLEELREIFRETLTGDRVERYETERVRKDGSLVDVSITLSPTKDAVGTVVGVSSIARDITERKRADQALREAQEGFRGAFDNAPIGMALFSADSDGGGRLIEVNRSLSRITGYSTQQLLDMDLHNITNPEDLERELPLTEQLLAGEIPNYSIEKRYLRPDGSEVWVTHSASTVYDSLGKLLYGVAQVEDITKRKLAEESLANAAAELERRATELERSNTDLQHFAYAASHDLSEPLRMVSSYVQLLAKRYQGQLDSDADEFIDFAVDGVTRMQGLIDGLLMYSRAGTSEYAMELVDTFSVVHTTIATMEASLQEAGASVTVDPLPVVRADETQLLQLFQNLISNAIKFVRDKPPVVHISASKQEGAWRFSVSDNGIGIDSQHAERIFTVFQRLHGRGEYSGSGIGLSICKRVVERHNGRIWVEPSAEGGSRFCFTIPTDGSEVDLPAPGGTDGPD